MTIADRGTQRSVMWFRRDLRLADNPALAAACSVGEVVPLFVIDPVFDNASPARRKFLDAAIAALDAELEGALVIHRGEPAVIVSWVAEQVEANEVYATSDFGPYGRRRDRVVGEALAAAGRRLCCIDSPYVATPGSIVKDDGTPYSVFTSYAKQWRQRQWAAPIERPRDPTWISLNPEPVDRSSAAESEMTDSVLPPPSEQGAADWWDIFRGDALSSYAEQRDRPDLDGTSRLSAHLRFGIVHPRQLLDELDPTNDDHAAFANELAWRDFYADVLYHHPESVTENLNRRFDAMVVDTGEEAEARFAQWCAGQTGFPIVDAGMRQLANTGWMHNRVRMIVASFLVKDLHLPWSWGAAHFMQHLCDGDVASNTHGWQWAAGSGTDAAPYFRVFNPTTQAERYDPDGSYVARYVPEYGTDDYPEPMVDHQAERREALARYEVVRRSG